MDNIYCSIIIIIIIIIIINVVASKLRPSPMKTEN